MRVAPRRHRSPESAFTIVEVLVGALIVTMVFAGAMYFIMGSGKSQQKSLVRQRMAAAADDISQRVRADAGWLREKPACKTAECDVSDLFPVPPAKDGDADFDADVVITPIDSASDGEGPADDDSVWPDFYRIHITITLDEAGQQKWGKQSAFETLSSVDATAIGRATGALVVQTCEAVNQVDERMSIAGCDGGEGTRRDMERQPSPCNNPFPLTWDQWRNARPVLPLGCNNAFEAAIGRSPELGAVRLRSVGNVGFTLRRDSSDGGPATVRTVADADDSEGSGTYHFSGLPAGTYVLETNAGAGRELWRTKTIPSAMRASVQTNQEARALIVVRPIQGRGQYGVRFTRAIWDYELTTFTDTDVYEEPAPGGGVVRTTTTFVYMRANRPERSVWSGPAWTGIVSMEPKPFDRYRDASNAVTQPTIVVAWRPVDDPDNGWRPLGPLPTGLHSLPAQQPGPQPAPDDFWGDFGTRSHDCNPGYSCGGFAWLDHRPGQLGNADSTVTYHSEDGECYIRSTIPDYRVVRRLQNGGGHADRCSRDLVYINPQTGARSVIRDFLPTKSGEGGKTMVLSSTQRTECIGCWTAVPPAEGTIGYPAPSESGSSTSVRSSTSPPPRTPSPPPKITVPPPPPSNMPAAPAVPSPGGGSGGGGLVLPAAPAVPSVGG